MWCQSKALACPIDDEDWTVTKFAELNSIEHGIRRALAILGDRGVEAALKDVLDVERSASLIRKCGNPDSRTNHIQHRYSVALDVGCIKAGHAPPLLEAHRALVERLGAGAALQQLPHDSDLSAHVLILQGALGRLAEAVVEAQSPDSPAGRRLSNREKHEIYEAIVKIDEQTATLKRMIK